MESLWQQTKDAASSSGVYEFGFFIFVETDMTGRVDFSTGATTQGARFPCGQEAKINIQDYENNFEAYQKDGDKFIVASFHTHPPQKYCAGCRDTTPSSDDYNTAATKKTPGILMDYSVSSLCYDHNIDLSYKIDPIGPPDRRIYIPTN